MSVGAVYGGQGRNKVTPFYAELPTPAPLNVRALPSPTAWRTLTSARERNAYTGCGRKNPDENNRSNFSESQREFVFTEIFDIIHLKYVYSIIEPLL